jgi:hypothetical protein
MKFRYSNRVNRMIADVAPITNSLTVNGDGV